MKILVFGASGFIGSNLCAALAKRGHEVYGFVRPTSRTKRLEKSGIRLKIGDLTDYASITRAVDGMDVVCNVAASYRNANAPDSEYVDANTKGPENVMKACFEKGIKKVVYASTVGVHGDIAHPPADENAPFNPGDRYQRTKLGGELAVRRYRDEKGVPTVIIRPVGVYGPGEIRFLKLFRSVKNGTFIMFGSGEVFYHLTYLDDLLNGFVAAIEKDEAIGKTYIVAGERATTLNELVEAVACVLKVRKPRLRLPFWTLWSASCLCEFLCKPLGIKPPLFRRRAHFFIKNRAFDTRRIQRELGIKPTVTLEEGLARTGRWYQENGWI